MFAEFEIPVFLLDDHHLAPFGSEIPGFVAVAVGEKLLLTHGIVAGVGFLVELVGGLEIREYRLDAFFVAVVSRLGPAVKLDAERFPKRGEPLGDLCHEACRIDSFLFGGLLDFLAVLIDTGEEVGLVATQAAVTGEDISEDLFVSVTDVGRAVGVVDGGGEKKHGDRWMGGACASRHSRLRIQAKLREGRKPDRNQG